MAQLFPGHLLLRNCVVHPVDLNVKFVVVRLLFVALCSVFVALRLVVHENLPIGSSVSRYHNGLVLDNSDVLVHPLAMKPVKAMTIRLSAEQAEELETVANVEALPVSEVIRAAIAEH